MMAASCRNRTPRLSFSDEPGFRVLTATSFVVPEIDHTALYTLPNSPDPSAFCSLKNYQDNNQAYAAGNFHTQWRYVTTPYLLRNVVSYSLTGLSRNIWFVQFLSYLSASATRVSQSVSQSAQSVSQFSPTKCQSLIFVNVCLFVFRYSCDSYLVIGCILMDETILWIWVTTVGHNKRWVQCAPSQG